MAAATVAKRARPKGSNFRPAEFRLVDSSQIGELDFSTRNGRGSIYWHALEQLRSAGPGKLLEVDSPTARGRFSHQARKHGVKVAFAERHGKLYIQLADGGSAQQVVLDLLRKNPQPIDEITKALARAGYDDVKVSEVITSLKDQIDLVTFGSVKKWRLRI